MHLLWTDLSKVLCINLLTVLVGSCGWQPALLYIVPCVIGFLAVHCAWNGEIKQVCFLVLHLYCCIKGLYLSFFSSFWVVLNLQLLWLDMLGVSAATWIWWVSSHWWWWHCSQFFRRNWSEHEVKNQEVWLKPSLPRCLLISGRNCLPKLSLWTLLTWGWVLWLLSMQSNESTV
jgi:hypothetical protein